MSLPLPGDFGGNRNRGSQSPGPDEQELAAIHAKIERTLAMEFEDIKAAFQNRKFEGYLFETPPPVVVTEVRRAAEKRQQKFDRRHIADYGIMIILVFLSLILVILQSSLMARAGASLVMLTLILQGLSAIWKARMEEKKRFDLSKFPISNSLKENLLNNCVLPEVGLHIFKMAFNDRQQSLSIPPKDKSLGILEATL
jgi:hypothetical protein